MVLLMHLPSSTSSAIHCLSGLSLLWLSMDCRQVERKGERSFRVAKLKTNPGPPEQYASCGSRAKRSLSSKRPLPSKEWWKVARCNIHMFGKGLPLRACTHTHTHTHKPHTHAHTVHTHTHTKHTHTYTNHTRMRTHTHTHTHQTQVAR